RILTIRGYERTQGTRPKTVKIEMWLRVENNNKYVRGKKKVRESIEQFLRCEYNLRQAHSKSWEYEFDVTYTTGEELEKTVDDIINTMSFEADLRNCFIEFDTSHLNNQPIDQIYFSYFRMSGCRKEGRLVQDRYSFTRSNPTHRNAYLLYDNNRSRPKDVPVSLLTSLYAYRLPRFPARDMTRAVLSY